MRGGRDRPASYEEGAESASSGLPLSDREGVKAKGREGGTRPRERVTSETKGRINRMQDNGRK
jgi:hypothetical protein